jgi:hypothetical protein
MTSATPPTGDPRSRPRDLLLSVVALLALAIGAIVVLALTDTTGGLVFALVAAAAATVGVALVIRRMVADADGAAPVRGARRSLAAPAVVAAAALVVAVVLGHGDATSRSTQAPDAAGAAQTVRGFLATAVLDDDAYAACEYLTPGERQRIAGLAGQGQTCRDALTATPPALAGVTSAGNLHGLRLGTRLQGTRARVAVSGARTPPLTFALRRATAAELEEFQAPPAAWRIDAGATALLPAGLG